MKKIILKNSVILILCLIVAAILFYYIKEQNTGYKEIGTSTNTLEIYRSIAGEVNITRDEGVCIQTDTSSYTVKNIGKEDQVIKSSDFLLFVNENTYNNDVDHKQVTLKKGEESTFDLKFEVIIPAEIVENHEIGELKNSEFTNHPASLVLMINGKDKLEIYQDAGYACVEYEYSSSDQNSQRIPKG